MIKKFVVTSLMALFVGLSFCQPALAADVPGGGSSDTGSRCGFNAKNLFGIQPWYACLPLDDKGNPRLEKLTDIYKIAFPLVDSLVKIAVFVAAGYIFFMLFKIAIARGDSGKISTAIMGIRDAAIGLIIAMISVAIVNFIAGAFV